MPRAGTGPDFIEALARGLEVIAAFRPGRPVMTLAEVATATGLARPTARRILLTLEELGYVRTAERGYSLTPRVLDLGVSYVRSMGLWEVARPHLERLVELAALSPDELERVLAEPTRSGLVPRWQPGRAERDAVLREVRARGWALTDEQLALGIRSVAAPLRDGSGRVIAGVNVNCHAAETSVERLLEHHLPLLLQTAGEISADFARLDTVPHVTVSAS
jgi:IclR family pca regulon transcriptional regulator